MEQKQKEKKKYTNNDKRNGRDAIRNRTFITGYSRLVGLTVI